MKREIKFRGLRTDGKGWIYGTYMEFNDRIYFCNWAYGPDFHELEERDFIEAIPESVGQFINAYSWNAKPIFSGDKVSVKGFEYIVEYSEQSCGYILRGENHIREFISLAAECNEEGVFFTDLEVIGNIHE